MFPTWDLVITIVFLVISGYNFILQRERITKLIIAAYIGLAIALIWGGSVVHFLGASSSLAQKLTESEPTMSSTRIGIFVIFTLLLTLKFEYNSVSKKSFGFISPIILILYSVLAALLILASIFAFLDENTLLSLLPQSQLAEFIYHYQLWFFISPAVLLIATGFLGKDHG